MNQESAAKFKRDLPLVSDAIERLLEAEVSKPQIMAVLRSSGASPNTLALCDAYVDFLQEREHGTQYHFAGG